MLMHLLVQLLMGLLELWKLMVEVDLFRVERRNI
jgi:hypothetical protein